MDLATVDDGRLLPVRGLYPLCPILAGSWPQERLPIVDREQRDLLDVQVNRAEMLMGIKELQNKNHTARPSFAIEEDVAQPVPTVITVNEFDPLRDDAIEFYRRRSPGSVARPERGTGSNALPTQIQQRRGSMGQRHRRDGEEAVMALRVVVIGGGAGGLAAALTFGRAGHGVTVLERDGAPPSQDPDDAFSAWDRPGVAHIRQGHLILARAINLLRANAPDVLDDLEARGARELPSISAFFPPELLEPADEDLRILPCRRIPFELALRRAVGVSGDVEVRGGTPATGLLLDAGDPPRVRGVTTADGEVYADLVIDAGGRHSPVRRWLAESTTVIDDDGADVELVYYGRYFRAHAGEVDGWGLASARGELESLQFQAFPGDRGTFGIVLAAPSWEKELRALRHEGAWDAAVRTIPALAPWVDAGVAEPLEPVRVMTGMKNRVRPFVSAGRPGALGWLPVGDAMCETDPTPAWGLSLAVHHAVEAAQAVDAADGDIEVAAAAYDSAVTSEARACVRVATAMNRARTTRWQGEAPDESDPDVARELLFAEGVAPVLTTFDDVVLVRALARRFCLLEPPDVVFDDAEVRRRALERRHAAAGGPRWSAGPDRRQLLDLLSSAAAGTGRG